MSIFQKRLDAATKDFQFFKKYIKIFIYFITPPPPPGTVVYATERSKAVVPVLFLILCSLWFIPRGALCFKVFSCPRFSRLF